MKVFPTEAQIVAAQKFLIALQFYYYVKTEFDSLKNEILQTENYHFDEIYYSEVWKEWGLRLPEDRILRRTKDLDLMSGERQKGRHGYNSTDSFKFNTEFRQRIIPSGFRYNENALKKAEEDVLHYQSELIRATESFHNLSPADIFRMSDKSQLVQRILDFVEPDNNSRDFEVLKQRFFNQRLNLPISIKGSNYKPDMESFKKFQQLKKKYTIEEFIEKMGYHHEEGYYDAVEAVLEYEEGYFIYVIKDNEHWKYKRTRSTRRKYIALFGKNSFYENNELEEVERALFTNLLTGNRRNL